MQSMNDMDIKTGNEELQVIEYPRNMCLLIYNCEKYNF